MFLRLANLDLTIEATSWRASGPWAREFFCYQGLEVPGNWRAPFGRRGEGRAKRLGETFGRGEWHGRETVPQLGFGSRRGCRG